MVQSLNEGRDAGAVTVGSIWSDGSLHDAVTGLGLVVVTSVTSGPLGEGCTAVTLDGAVQLRGSADDVLDGFSFVARVPHAFDAEALAESRGPAAEALRVSALALVRQWLSGGGLPRPDRAG